MTDVFTHGGGPFVTPLCTRVVGLSDQEGSDAVVLEFQLEDGAKMLVPIARDQVETLSQLFAVQDIRQGGGATGKTKQ